jgi:hypothetical protein
MPTRGGYRPQSGVTVQDAEGRAVDGREYEHSKTLLPRTEHSDVKSRPSCQISASGVQREATPRPSTAARTAKSGSPTITRPSTGTRRVFRFYFE